MQVRSKKSTKKLVKGLLYECEYYESQYDSIRIITPNGQNIWSRLSTFTLPNGDSIVGTWGNRNRSWEPTKVKPGDVIICNSDSYKYLIRGCKYRISEVKDDNSAYYKRQDILIEGYKRWIKYTDWNFRKLNTQESRDLALSQIFDKPEDFSVEVVSKVKQNRIKDGKSKLVIDSLIKSITDRNRHSLDLIDWTIDKNPNMGFTREDFNELFDMKIGDLIKMYE